MSESCKNGGENMPLKRTPFVDASSSRCRLRRSSSSLRAAANRSFSSRSNRASYSSSVSFRSPTGSAFPDRAGECSSSFCRLCLRFRLCRLPSRSVVLPGERDLWRRLLRLWVPSVSSPDSLALTEGSFAGSKGKMSYKRLPSPSKRGNKKESTRTWRRFLPQLELSAIVDDHGDRRPILFIRGHLGDLAHYIVETADHLAKYNVFTWGSAGNVCDYEMKG